MEEYEGSEDEVDLSINFNKAPKYTFNRSDLDLQPKKRQVDRSEHDKFTSEDFGSRDRNTEKAKVTASATDLMESKARIWIWHESQIILSLIVNETGTNITGNLLTSSNGRVKDHICNNLDAIQEKNGMHGITQLLLKIFGIIEEDYAEYLQENSSYLWQLAQKAAECEIISRDPHSKKLKLAAEIYQLSARYIGLERRVRAAIDAMSHVKDHRYFSSLTARPEGMTKLQGDWQKVTDKLERHLKTVTKLQQDTATLSNSIVNLTNLEEIVFASRVAKSAQVIAFVALLCLPIALVLAFFGMNVFEFTRDKRMPTIYIPVGIIFGSLVMMLGAYVLWYRHVQRRDAFQVSHSRV
ncbi:hypothetical protein M501DRAFT_593493 [Patellaria atrata CBS 101060]|uniref:Uncharacterized protein n=1 Tax=Patellaria atrata CBS 101060 TaxID=1346257 RepID=A0A9P4VLN9_9PEZI|nr:hypothetical protein M501DRAFT_593493 [Patellaria atrata CBS 101060]